MKKKLPNVLTISRVFLAAGFIIFLLKGNLISFVIATIFFITASVTDYLDGYFAKKHNGVTNFGKIMDPIADKFLILAAFFLFARMGIIAAWMFYVIMAREILVTGLRLWAMKEGKFLAAEQAGKYKTVLQISSVILILLYLISRKTGWLAESSLVDWQISIYIVMLLTVGLTVYSGISYLWNNRKILYA